MWFLKEILYWTISANYRPFWTQSYKIYIFDHTIESPRKFYRLLMCHTLGCQNGHLGPLRTLFGSKFRNQPDKNIRTKKNVLHIETIIWNLQKELSESITNCSVQWSMTKVKKSQYLCFIEKVTYFIKNFGIIQIKTCVRKKMSSI